MTFLRRRLAAIVCLVLAGQLAPVVAAELVLGCAPHAAPATARSRSAMSCCPDGAEPGHVCPIGRAAASRAESSPDPGDAQPRLDPCGGCGACGDALVALLGVLGVLDPAPPLAPLPITAAARVVVPPPFDRPALLDVPPPRG